MNVVEELIPLFFFRLTFTWLSHQWEDIHFPQPPSNIGKRELYGRPSTDYSATQMAARFKLSQSVFIPLRPGWKGWEGSSASRPHSFQNKHPHIYTGRVFLKSQSGRSTHEVHLCELWNCTDWNDKQKMHRTETRQFSEVVDFLWLGHHVFCKTARSHDGFMSRKWLPGALMWPVAQHDSSKAAWVILKFWIRCSQKSLVCFRSYVRGAGPFGHSPHNTHALLQWK